MRFSPKVLTVLITALVTPALAHADEDASRLIERHLEVRGDSSTEAPFQALIRKGTYSEGRFQAGLTWTRSQQNGLHEERHWTHLGRKHNEVRAHNGEITWSQAVAPQTKRPATLTGDSKAQFLSVGWMVTDIAFPLRQALSGEWETAYIDDRTIRNRSAAWVEIESNDSIQMTYIFDLESGLILAIEMPFRFAGTLQSILAVPVGISRIEGGIIESGFDFYIDGQKFRSLRFDENIANKVDREPTFDPPHIKEFWLR
jgi:hypothetical protein|tara:strand:+ start:6650 stop:7423 length:774 start_codon:yes stop_codon:yes gene_type:complete